MAYSSSSSFSSSVSQPAYQFRYFPRYGRWTKEMQIELDEHSRRMAQLMMHVQDMHKSREQRIKDEQREDSDEDCIGSPVFSQGSSGFTSRSNTISSQTIHGQFDPWVQYPPAISTQFSSGFTSRSQPIHGQFTPQLQYIPAQQEMIQQRYTPVSPYPPGYPHIQYHYYF